MSTPSERQQQCSNITYGYIDPKRPNAYGESHACVIPYGYTPSLALCVLGISLFFIAFWIHAFLILKYRSWYFSIILFGPALEVVGYIPRTLSSQTNPYSSTFFVLQYFFIVIAPLAFSAAIYTIISVTINRVGREFAPLPPKIILCIFIVADVVATVLQVFETAGVALVGVPNSASSGPGQSNTLLLAGLAVQVASFALFILCLCWFALKSRKATSRALKRFLAAVLLAALVVYVRTCFRLAETVQGLSGYLATHEVFFGCLELLPVVTAVYILMYWHPGRWLGSKHTPGKGLREKRRRGSEEHRLTLYPSREAGGDSADG